MRRARFCKHMPEWVIFNRAPVAFLWTRISFDFASRVRGTNAPDLAIFVLLSSNRLSERGKKIYSRLAHTMSGQIGDASNSIALDFDVGTQHLPDQWLESTEFYYQKLVVG